ncbi:unnamed protein product [Pseudo-nitzschia multistriata]|uniref:Uncharacterized protein n=1 Tax=Pseudo-nitzschia multistriata TaxID=183589 RepID=A0A448ZF01_9STRA|nr:unnamed protein product [Pseudo-nitzschia multistriata]
MWAWTNVLAASAASRLSSPAIVAAATTVASFLALAPGVEPPPLHPIASRQAACAGSEVPPPTVPTSMLGIVQHIQRSPFSFSSIRVMQLEDSTFCAGSCPVAKKTAVTMFEAWALNPPIAPAMADPIRFLLRLVCTNAATVVLRVGNQLARRKIALQCFDDGKGSLRDHVHSHGISRKANQSQVHILPCDGRVALLELAKACRGLKGLLQNGKVLGLLAPDFQVRGFHRRAHAEAGGTGDPVAHDSRLGTASLRNGLGPTIGRGHQASLRGGHRDVYRFAVEGQRADQAHRERNVADDNLAVRSVHARVVQGVFRGELLEDVAVGLVASEDGSELSVAGNSSNGHCTEGIQEFFQHVVLDLVAQHQVGNFFVRELLQVVRGRGLRFEGRWVAADGGARSGGVDGLLGGAGRRLGLGFAGNETKCGMRETEPQTNSVNKIKNEQVLMGCLAVVVAMILGCPHSSTSENSPLLSHRIALHRTYLGMTSSASLGMSSWMNDTPKNPKKYIKKMDHPTKNWTNTPCDSWWRYCVAFEQNKNTL